MNKIIDLIQKQIDIIEQTTGSEITISDNYNFFAKTELKKLPQLDRWHLNKYCLYVKDNPQIFRKCRKLKHIFFKKVMSADRIIKSTCFCGVADFAAPIFINDVYLGEVSAMGFVGDFSERKCRNLSKRLNISLDELTYLRSELLRPTDNQNAIEAQLEILTFLIKEYLINETDTLLHISGKNKVGNTYVLNALEYIDQNFTEDISVYDVAKYCFISVPYLQSLFSDFLGHGIAEEIRLKRISYAKELLLTTEYSVKHVAFECGFESADYFSVVFKKQCNTTPLKFRKQHTRR